MTVDWEKAQRTYDEVQRDETAKVQGDLTAKIEVILREADELRSRVRLEGGIDDSPSALHESLLEHRRVLDRMDALVSNVLRAKARMERAFALARDELELAEAKAQRLDEEYTTAKERNSHLLLQTIDRRVTFREAERVRDDVAYAYEYLRWQHRGVDSSRRDVETRLRMVTLQTSLER